MGDLPAKRRTMSVVMMVVGAAILSYVGAEYARSYLGQRKLAQEWRNEQQVANGSETPDPTQARLTRISIPKIGVDAIVVEGTTRHALLLGPGHMRKTAPPGAAGNAVITGHRDTFFRHLHELEKGDLIVVRRAGKTYQYEVTSKRVVAADDLSVLQPSNSGHLTLITCYPTYYIGPAPERLVVFAQLAGDAGELEAKAASSHSPSGVSLRK